MTAREVRIEKIQLKKLDVISIQGDGARENIQHFGSKTKKILTCGVMFWSGGIAATHSPSQIQCSGFA